MNPLKETFQEIFQLTVDVIKTYIFCENDVICEFLSPFSEQQQQKWWWLLWKKKIYKGSSLLHCQGFSLFFSFFVFVFFQLFHSIIMTIIIIIIIHKTITTKPFFFITNRLIFIFFFWFFGGQFLWPSFCCCCFFTGKFSLSIIIIDQIQLLNFKTVFFCSGPSVFGNFSFFLFSHFGYLVAFSVKILVEIVLQGHTFIVICVCVCVRQARTHPLYQQFDDWFWLYMFVVFF